LQTSKANLLHRLIAKFIDLLLVAAFSKLLPPVGFFGGMTYLLIADGFGEGRSLGKWLIGLKTVVVEKNCPCTFRESILRNSPLAIGYLLFFVPYIGWLFCLAVLSFEMLLIVGNEKGLRIGDEIGGTQVFDSEGMEAGLFVGGGEAGGRSK
jgi:uncharacterized RDD family membrane protein YckC